MAALTATSDKALRVPAMTPSVLPVVSNSPTPKDLSTKVGEAMFVVPDPGHDSGPRTTGDRKSLLEVVVGMTEADVLDSLEQGTGDCSRRYTGDSVMGYLRVGGTDGQAGDADSLSWSAAVAKLHIVTADIQQYFKPLFDKSDNGELSVSALRKELGSAKSTQLLSHACISHHLAVVGGQEERGLTYRPFLHLVTGGLRKERARALRALLGQTCATLGVSSRARRAAMLAHYKGCPPPLFTPAITLALVLLFLAYAMDMQSRGPGVGAISGYPWYSPLVYLPHKRWQAWRFLTYSFVHSGYLHVMGSVIFLLLAGVPMEMVHGLRRIVLIYGTGVITGSLVHSVVDSNIAMVGASGGVYAILGVHLTALVTNWRELGYRACGKEEFADHACCALGRALTSGPGRLTLIIIYGVTELALAVVRRVVLGERAVVGLTAHVVGLLCGAVLGVGLLWDAESCRWGSRRSWLLTSLVLLLWLCCLLFNALYTDWYRPTDWTWD